MIRALTRIAPLLLLISITGCVKDTYNMNMLSKEAHLSPVIVISAVKGDVSFSDMVKASDTVVYDKNNFVTLVFKEDSVIVLKLSDFSKGPVVQKTAVIEPSIFDLSLQTIVNNISGDFKFVNPSINLKYSNSFSDSLVVNLIIDGINKNDTMPLNLAPFSVLKPDIPVEQEITSSYLIDKSNSNLQDIISMPPEKLKISGSVVLKSSAKSLQPGNDLLSPNQLLGSLEVDLPLELSISNLQYKDTEDNFIKQNSVGKDSLFKPEDIQFLRINLTAENGFPLAASVKMSLYDSASGSVLSTVDASGILKPAPVDSNGKASGTTQSTAIIEFTNEFFSKVNDADKIIFTYTLITPDNGTKAVKIYSDYRIKFSASLVVKPDINLSNIKLF
jgi:hypothetical protein